MKTVSKLAISAIFLTALANPTAQANLLLIPMVGGNVAQEVGKQVDKEVLREMGKTTLFLTCLPRIPNKPKSIPELPTYHDFWGLNMQAIQKTVLTAAVLICLTHSPKVDVMPFLALIPFQTLARHFIRGFIEGFVEKSSMKHLKNRPSFP